MSTLNNLPKGANNQIKYKITSGKHHRRTVASLGGVVYDMGFIADGNGDVVRTGGSNGQIGLSTVEKFDKDTYIKKTVGNLSQSAAVPSTANGNGDVTVCIATVLEKFDKDTNVRTAAGTASYSANLFGFTTDGNGDVVRAGGGGNSYYSKVEKFDKDTNARKSVGVLSEPASDIGFAADGNGDVLRMCGRGGTVEKFDKDTSIRHVLRKDIEMQKNGIATDGNGNVIRAGGIYQFNAQSSVVGYDKDVDVAIAFLPLSASVYSPGFATDGNGNVVRAGGGGDSAGTVEKYDMFLSAPLKIPPYSFARSMIDKTKTINDSATELEKVFKTGDVVSVGYLNKKIEI